MVAAGVSDAGKQELVAVGGSDRSLRTFVNGAGWDFEDAPSPNLASSGDGCLPTSLDVETLSAGNTQVAYGCWDPAGTAETRDWRPGVGWSDSRARLCGQSRPAAVAYEQLYPTDSTRLLVVDSAGVLLAYDAVPGVPKCPSYRFLVEVGGRAWALAVADLDKDGAKEIAVLNSPPCSDEARISIVRRTHRAVTRSEPRRGCP
jgi:hypothetical protein